jgi:hypothetical protein
MAILVLTHVEGEPSTQLHPAGTKLHISVAVESTCLDAEVRNARNAECQSLWDAEVHVAPHGVGVTCDDLSVPCGRLNLEANSPPQVPANVPLPAKVLLARKKGLFPP